MEGIVAALHAARNDGMSCNMAASTYDIPETILRGYLKNNVLNETNIELLILMQISTLNNYKWLGNLDGLWHAGHEEVHESSCKINGAAQHDCDF